MLNSNHLCRKLPKGRGAQHHLCQLEAVDEAGEKIIRPTKPISKPSAAVKELLQACPSVSTSVAQRTNEDEEVSALIWRWY